MKTKNTRSFRRTGSLAGFSLVEVMCSASLAVVTLTAALITFSAVHRSFMAAIHQMDAQADQNRVQSYIRRDLRGASGVEVTDQGTKLTVTLPAQNSPSLNLNLGLPLLSILCPTQSAPKNTTIRYYRQGTTVIREVNGVATELSASATEFAVGLQGSLAKVKLGFQPRFCFNLRSISEAATLTDTYVQLVNATYVSGNPLL